MVVVCCTSSCVNCIVLGGSCSICLRGCSCMTTACRIEWYCELLTVDKLGYHTARGARVCRHSQENTAAANVAPNKSLHHVGAYHTESCCSRNRPCWLSLERSYPACISCADVILVRCSSCWLCVLMHRCGRHACYGHQPASPHCRCGLLVEQHAIGAWRLHPVHTYCLIMQRQLDLWPGGSV